MNTKKKILILIIFLAFILVAAVTSPVIFQEGNPLPLMYGIGLLHFSDSEIIKFGILDNTIIKGVSNKSDFKPTIIT